MVDYVTGVRRARAARSARTRVGDSPEGHWRMAGSRERDACRRSPRPALGAALRTALVVLAGLGAGGCWTLGQLYVGLVKPKDMRDIPKEHDLEAERLLILPYAGTDIRFNYPAVPLEIGLRIGSVISQHLPERVGEVVHPVRVARWQESNLEWLNMTPEEVGREFEADTVLYIEMDQYSMMEEKSANLLRGRAGARIQVVEVGAASNPVYEGTVEVVFPKDRPVNALTISERAVREATNRLFGEAVVNKFRDRRVEVVAGEVPS